MLGHYFHEFSAQGVHAIPKVLSHSLPSVPFTPAVPRTGQQQLQCKGGARQQNSIIPGIYTLFASQQ